MKTGIFRCKKCGKLVIRYGALDLTDDVCMGCGAKIKRKRRK